LWIFVGAPYVERLRGHRALNSALTAVTAAVVGVIANLAVWFALHVLFGELRTHSWGPLHLELPVLTSLDPIAFALAAFAFVLMFVFRLGLLRTLLLCAAAGAALHLVTA
jgi:chromate transporter